MAGPDRAATHALDAAELERALAAEPHRFGFYPALRRIECAYRDRPRLGESSQPSDDPLRLTQEPSLAFAASSLARFEPRSARAEARLALHLFGLLGPNGPLPHHLTEYARDRMRNSGDDSLRRFLDLFHHRILSLFYRAWADAQPTVQHDRPDDDRFATWLGALIGIALPALRDRDGLPDAAKLQFAGHLGGIRTNAEGLRKTIAAFFEVPTRIVEFRGRWVAIPSDGWTRLGGGPDTAALGVTTTLGSEVWDGQQSFRIVLGPLALRDYERFLPGGASIGRLQALVRSHAGDQDRKSVV